MTDPAPLVPITNALTLPGGSPATLRETLAAAVDLLPALPPADPRDRYAIRHVTVLWLETDKTEHTRRAYYADLAAWLSWCDRTGLDPLQARRADVDAWKNGLTVTGRDGTVRPASPSTVGRTLAGVSSWYRYLQSNDLTERNPVAAVNRPKTGKRPPLPALDRDSAAALLNHVEDRARRNDTEASWRDAAVVALLFYTGVRVSAVTTAEVGDLDSDAGHTILRYTGKGGHRDFVPLVPAALHPLRRYLELRAARTGVTLDQLRGPLLATTPHPHDPAKPGGKALSQRHVWHLLRTQAEAAGLEAASTISPHTARRTTGTLLLAHDVPVQKVQDLLGHADIRTTRDHYDAHRHKLETSPVHTLAQLLADARHRRS
ncbi:tyrosine-type recombinase/integrase [Amycolatopsis thermophila]|uniref:Site-specific recombinase XerD n=1 Tax=Amycolatopsis thermophila TaxID=206084 RepID=A0ABU0F2Y1_9PSEU|nr:tyrosine-type recombinase/integrase [Amycolatopsis thermophila]MDQ0381699.1 site-specific recombinase XerD [Amycolatopsis thermophila]